jgi:predicted permease
MDLTIITITQIAEMFIIMIIGVIATKFRVITKDGNKQISDILIYIVTPILIVSSYQQEFSIKKLAGLGIAFLLAVLTHIIGIIAGKLFISRKSKNVAVERMSIIYTNCGFIGLPLLYAIFGADGIFYGTAYITVFNIFMWSHGLLLLNMGNKAKQTSNLQKFIKIITHPNIVSIIIGLLFYLFRISLPKIIIEPFYLIDALNSPLAMLVAGSTLAGAPIKKIFRTKRIYLVSFVCLIVVPFVSLLVFKAIIYACAPFYIIDTTIVLSILIGVSCPAGAMTTMLALLYNKDSEYASSIFSITTLLCIVTIPLVIFVYGLF